MNSRRRYRGPTFRPAGQALDLVEPSSRGPDNAGISSGLDLFLQAVALRAAGDVDERRHPVEGGEHFVHDHARPDHARPAHDQWRTHAAFPRGQLAAREGGGAAVRVGDRLGAVVGGEDDDGVVGLAHVVHS